MAIRWHHERWVKLYTKEEGSFAQLPLYVRALGAMLLKIADPATGRICLRGKQPWEAIAFQLGADASDRRLLRKHIPILIVDGYIEVEGGDLFVRNFTIAQTGTDRVKVAPNASEARAITEPSATETRVVHGSSTSCARAVHELCTTTELSNENQAGLSRRSEEKREEENGEQVASLALVPATPKAKKQSHHQQAVNSFHEAYKRQNATAPTWDGKSTKIIADLVKAHGAAEVQRRIEILFLGQGPPWIRPPFDVGTLRQHFDKLAAPTTPVNRNQPAETYQRRPRLDQGGS